MRRLLHWRIPALLAAGLVMAGLGCGQKKADPKEVAAVVNGQPIPRAEIDQQYERLVAKFREASPNLQFSDDKRQQMMQNFLDRAIRDKVILQEADRRGITVEDAEVDTRIEQLKKMFGGTPEGEAKFMEGVQDMADFRIRIADQIRISKVLEAASEDVPQPGDAEIQAHYEENRTRFDVPETVTASHVLAAFQDPSAGRPAAATPTAEQKQASRERIEAAKAKLDAGTDFAEVAREFSQDPGSAPRGGELGAFRRGQMVGPFEETAFALKPGEVSGIIETQYGYHIIKVTDRAAGGQRTLDEVREEIVRSIQQRARQDGQNKFVEDLKAKAKIEILDGQPPAEPSP